MTIEQLYTESSIKPLPPADRLRLATLILEGMPLESVVDYSEEWSDADLHDLSRASLTRAAGVLEAHTEE